MKDSETVQDPEPFLGSNYYVYGADKWFTRTGLDGGRGEMEQEGEAGGGEGGGRGKRGRECWLNILQHGSRGQRLTLIIAGKMS